MTIRRAFRSPARTAVVAVLLSLPAILWILGSGLIESYLERSADMLRAQYGAMQVRVSRDPQGVVALETLASGIVADMTAYLDASGLPYSVEHRSPAVLYTHPEHVTGSAGVSGELRVRMGSDGTLEGIPDGAALARFFPANPTMEGSIRGLGRLRSIAGTQEVGTQLVSDGSIGTDSVADTGADTGADAETYESHMARHIALQLTSADVSGLAATSIVVPVRTRDSFARAFFLQQELQDLTSTELQVVPWQELEPSRAAASSIGFGAVDVLVLAVLLLSVPALIQAILVSMQEQARAAGLMRSIGVPDGKIRGLLREEFLISGAIAATIVVGGSLLFGAIAPEVPTGRILSSVLESVPAALAVRVPAGRVMLVAALVGFGPWMLSWFHARGVVRRPIVRLLQGDLT